MQKNPTREFEERLKSQGYVCIVGIDEVGRGAWAGPLVAAACVLDPNFTSTELRDSKQLSASKREHIADELKKSAVAYGIGSAEPFEIDLFGVTQATQLAFRRALNEIHCRYDYILVDGFVLEGARIPCEGIVKGDEKILSIAAASVIAKVERDAIMREYAKKYPEYGFDRHVGYGTKEHVQSIMKFGHLPIHRKLFLRNLLGDILEA